MYLLGLLVSERQDCELEELQREYNRKVIMRITTQVLELEPGSLAPDDDIRQHMNMQKAAEISGLTNGAVTVVTPCTIPIWTCCCPAAI